MAALLDGRRAVARLAGRLRHRARASPPATASCWSATIATSKTRRRAVRAGTGAAGLGGAAGADPDDRAGDRPGAAAARGSGQKPGHEIEYPLAVVILGGLVTSTLLNLFLLPPLYLRFGRRSPTGQRPRGFTEAWGDQRTDELLQRKHGHSTLRGPTHSRQALGDIGEASRTVAGKSFHTLAGSEAADEPGRQRRRLCRWNPTTDPVLERPGRGWRRMVDELGIDAADEDVELVAGQLEVPDPNGGTGRSRSRQDPDRSTRQATNRRNEMRPRSLGARR